MASTYLTRTPGSAGNRRTFTLSGWFKRGSVTDSGILFEARIDNNNRFDVRFDGVKLMAYAQISSSEVLYLVTSAVLRDPSAWYHIVVTIDTTQSTQSDRAKIYVNGEQVTSFSTNTNSLSSSQDTPVNTTNPHSIGANTTGGGAYDGYMAHVHLTDGYAYAASTFGSTATNGQWVPNIAPSVTYGTNGYFLKFTNASDLGEDFSGNNNDYTKSGSGDKVSDCPENVFATMNPNDNYWANSTFSEGNCKMVTAGSGYGYPRSTIGLSTGKWYFEAKASSLSGNLFVGIVSTAQTGTEQEVGYSANDYGYKFTSGAIRTAGSETSYGNSISTSDILGVGIDLDNNKLYFSKNGTWQNSADPVSGSNGFSITAPSSTVVGEYFPTGSDINSSNSSTVQFNFGNPSFTISSGNADGNGKGTFEYAPPTGYLAICTDNVSSELTLPIGKGGSYMNTVLYTGNGSNGHAITGVGFQPDLVWLKSRSNGEGHWWGDSNRGVNLRLRSNDAGAEYDTGPGGNNYPGVSAFDSDGFTVGRSDAANGNGNSMVAWNWRAGGSTASNTDGNITSTVSVNTTAGFSIVLFTGNATAGATVGHGLGVKPEIIFAKNRTDGANWNCYAEPVDNTGDYTLTLNGTGAKSNSFNMWNDTAPTSSVITLGNRNETNGNSHNMVFYCFHSVEGYSKFGSYTGNGSTDGAFVYTGFRPALVIVKKYSAGENWNMTDSTRSPFNVCQHGLSPSTSSAEDTTNGVRIDLLSNGFKARDTAGQYNDNGANYIFISFAEHPFVDSSGVPANAR